MAIRINNNVPMLRAQRAFMRSTRESFQAAMRLATGKRINRGADDPAGVIAGASLGAHAKSLTSEIKALERERFLIRAKDGALSEIANLGIELDSLVVQAANTGGTSVTERDSLRLQAGEIIKAMHFIQDTSSFNGELFLRTSGVATRFEAAIKGDDGDLLSGDLESAKDATHSALSSVNQSRAIAGARERFGVNPIFRVKSVELENTVAAQSSIEDTDFAKEVSTFVRAKTLEQTGLSAIQVAQTAYELALQLVDQAKESANKIESESKPAKAA